MEEIRNPNDPNGGDLNSGDKVDTTTTDGTNGSGTPNNSQPNDPTQNQKEKTYSKDEINDIMKKRLAKLYNEFGVDNNDALKELVGKGQSFEETQKKLQETQSELQDLKNEVLLKDSGISAKYINLAKLYFKSKNLEINGDNIKALIDEFPEWKGQVQTNNDPIKVGGNPSGAKPTPTARDKVREIYGKIGG